jgi:glycosyltransferase involved in cell wall biosynthesis
MTTAGGEGSHERIVARVEVLERAVHDLGAELEDLRRQLGALVSAVREMRPALEDAVVQPEPPPDLPSHPGTPSLARRAARKLVRMTLGSARRMWQASAPETLAFQGLVVRRGAVPAAPNPRLAVVSAGRAGDFGRETELRNLLAAGVAVEVAVWDRDAGSLRLLAGADSDWQSLAAGELAQVVAALSVDAVLGLPLDTPVPAPETLESLGWALASDGARFVHLLAGERAGEPNHDLFLVRRELWWGWDAPAADRIARDAELHGLAVVGRIACSTRDPAFALTAASPFGPGGRLTVRREGARYLVAGRAAGVVEHWVAPLRCAAEEGSRSALVVLTSPPVGGVEVWLGELIRQLAAGGAVTVLAAVASEALFARRLEALRRLGARVYPLGGVLDPLVWRSVLELVVARTGARRVLHVGHGGVLLDALATLPDRHPGLELSNLALDPSGCRAEPPAAPLRRASLHLAVTAAAERELARDLPASGGRVQRIRLASRRDASPERGFADAAGRRPGDVRRVVMISDLVPAKRPEDFVALAARLRERPELELTLLGEGPLAGSLLDLASYLGLSRFRLEAPAATPSELVRTADVVVSTAEAEPFPWALLEAAALGRPVVAAAVDDLGELLGSSAQLVAQPGDVAAFVAAFERALVAPRDGALTVTAAAPDVAFLVELLGGAARGSV